MAKTIEERAKEFANDYTSDDAIFIKGFLHTACYDGYCDGATDQRKIDIEKACEAYCKTCDTKECEEFGGEMCDWVKKFRKLIKEG